ncbi:TIGR03617 family F420-dependent LLM class oxidoreductase [Mycobacterium sp. C31M]
MYVDCNIGGGPDGTTGGAVAELISQVASARRLGFDGAWSTEVNRDPFLPLAIAAAQSTGLQLGTAVAVAFARSPMTTAAVANDLQSLSGGRFVLGLGSQIRPHIERRFSMPWSDPVGRMREYIAALQAIWHSWSTGAKLDFRGEHYQHTLMTPMFAPEPHPYGPPPILLAAVGPKMTSVAAESADGLILHSFTSARYLREVTLPIVEAGLATSDRRRAQFTVCYPGLVATGGTAEALTGAVESVRRQIAFYGSTPAYRAVLDLHGLGDLHVELHRLSKAGEWDTMTALIDDTVLDTLAVVGEPMAAGRELVARFGGLIDRFTLSTPYPLDDAARAGVVEGIRSVGQERSAAAFSSRN